MGRGGGKVTMKYIQDDKVRKSAFTQRKKGLTKKVSEFSKNFGVEACLIVYDGDDDSRPMSWPQDFTSLQSILTKYEQQKIGTTLKKFDVKDYFANKKNKVETEILNVRKKIMMNKYPTWGKCFSNLEMEQLGGFIDTVNLKIEACNQRINMLKNMQQMQNTAQMQNVAPENVASPQLISQPDDPINPLVDISEMLDFSDLIEWDDIIAERNDDPMNPIIDNIPQMQLDNISLPPVSSTGEFGKLDNIMDRSDQGWATQLEDLDNWAVNILNDGDGWVKQPYMFECQDFWSLSEMEQ